MGKPIVMNGSYFCGGNGMRSTVTGTWQPLFALIVAMVFWSAVASATEIGYVGRLAEPNGSPVTGTVTLEAKFFRAEAGGNALVGAKVFAVTLDDGIFQINVALTAAEFHVVFPSVGTQAFIEIIDKTNNRTYPRHAFSPVPYALKIPVDGLTAGYDGDGRLHVGPSSAATPGQFLTSDASGQLTWATPAGGGGASVTDAINDGLATVAPSQNAVFDALALKEPALPNGTSVHYLRGDRTWQPLSTAAVQEGAFLYFTDSRAQTAAVANAINPGTTNIAPSQNAVYDALALKSNNSHAHSSLAASDGDPAAAVAVDATGNVGIGTTTPGSNRLKIVGSGTSSVLYEDSVTPNLSLNSTSSSFTNIQFQDNGTYKWIVQKDSGENFQILDKAFTSRFSILQNGNVGIGTTLPARKLHISDAIRIEPSVVPPPAPMLGDIYVDTSNAVCVYVDAAWTKIAGTGLCS